MLTDQEKDQYLQRAEYDVNHEHINYMQLFYLQQLAEKGYGDYHRNKTVLLRFPEDVQIEEIEAILNQPDVRSSMNQNQKPPVHENIARNVPVPQKVHQPLYPVLNAPHLVGPPLQPAPVIHRGPVTEQSYENLVAQKVTHPLAKDIMTRLYRDKFTEFEKNWKAISGQDLTKIDYEMLKLQIEYDE